MITKFLFAFALFVMACSGEPLDSDDLGELSSAIMTKYSATGERTWGVKTTDAHRTACTRNGSSSQVCKFVSTAKFESADMVYKICVKPQFLLEEGEPDYYAEAVALVNVFVSNMNSAGQGSPSVGWSFSQVFSDGPNCNGVGANVIVVPGITSGTLGSSYGQYAAATFSGCVNLTEPTPINGTYQTCTGATVAWAPKALKTYALSQGAGAGKAKTLRDEALHHALNTVVGIGAQSSNSNFVSYPTMSFSNSKFPLSNEETCRMKGLSKLSQGVPPNAGMMEISSTSCAN
jgi:hypothetical protein